MSGAFERIIAKLEAAGKTLKVPCQGHQAMAQCPAHDDSTPSLHITGIEGAILLHCFAGCATSEVLDGLGLTMADLYDDPKGAEYHYSDGRIVHRRPDKAFWQSGNTRGRNLFRAEAVTQSVSTVYVCEGEKDCLAIEAIGGVAVTPPGGAGKGKRIDRYDWTPLRDKSVVIISHQDEVGRAHASAVATLLTSIAANITMVEARTGNDAADHIAAGGTLDDFVPVDTQPAAAAAISLESAHAVFRRWLGDEYDTDALDAMLATVAVEKFDDGSDPIWLLLISGPGNAKTETVQALDGIGAVVASSISSDAALLSATPKKDRAKNATGGLLRKIGDRGVLVIKDVTSILSMDRNMRARVLAALREVYDGRWVRDVGTDGGRTIPWTGRICVVGAVTTAWDTAHSVISTMGDRFVLLRIDSAGKGRQAAGRKAIGNTGFEKQMRGELAEAVAGVILGMDSVPVIITADETDALLDAADLVTKARTGVECDYRGDVVDAHAPEMPTRFAKQLAQIVRGSVAIGMGRVQALRLAIRCARDSMPPLRLAIIDDLAENPGSTTSDVRRRLDKPRTTVDRQIQALHMLGIVAVEEEQTRGGTRWRYSLSAHISPDAIKPKPLPDLLVGTSRPLNKRQHHVSKVDDDSVSNISGESAIAHTSVRWTRCECGNEMLSEESVARGYCERCRLAHKREPA